MKRLFLLLFIWFPSWAFACMPPSPWEVMVGRIASLSESRSGEINIDFSTYDFPFRDYLYENPTSWHWQNYSNTTYPSLGSGELIIALSDFQDGSFPQEYSIFHITTLSCENDTIQLGKRYGTVMGWDRKNGKCGYEAKSLLDVFVDGDESIWLKKLQEKYPTCDDLQKAFPPSQEVFPKNVNVPSLENDVVINSTWFHWFDWVLSKIDTFFGLF